MAVHVNGIIQSPNGYAVKNFMDKGMQPIMIGNLSFTDYETAVNALAGKSYPESYRLYLLAVKDMEPSWDTWNNLIFTGHVKGYYDHEAGHFKNARQLNMYAGDGTETAYIKALEETYKSIQSMVH